MQLNTRKWQISLLLSGVILLVLSQVRFGVGVLAWVAPVPFIVFLNNTRGWRSRMVFSLTLVFAWALASAKYITPPLPYFLILLNGVSYGVVNTIAYVSWDRLRRTLPGYLSNLAFAAIFVFVEWLQHRFTPLASNGAAAYTQLENLPFLQLVSLFGIAGPCFLINWFAAIAADEVTKRQHSIRQMAVVISLIVLTNTWGAFRIGAPEKHNTVKVATVGTDFDWMGGPLPDNFETRKINDALFDRTVKAAKAGAKLVVWNEVSTIVSSFEEPDFVERGSRIAKRYHLHIVMSFIVPKEPEPLKVENKYVWIDPEGAVIDTYLKHRPVPGEPSIPGDGNARAFDTDFGRITGAICYEFDFPEVGRDRGSKGADLVFLPSSDTAGVDPFHTQIAAVRAIENGFSVLRSTRMGLSAGIDPHGRIRGWLSANETDERILFVTLPQKTIWTLYSKVGDVLVYASLLYIVAVLIMRLSKRRKKRG